MSDNFYLKLNHYIQNHKRLSRVLVILSRVITLAFYVIYPLFLAYSFYIFGFGIIKAALVPLISLIIVSLIRILINRKRPYEKLDITPLYNKKTRGKSFPSRHSFAILIIAVSLGIFLHPILLLPLIIISIILGALRVLLGVHYISDVIAGFLFALLFALLGYKIL